MRKKSRLHPCMLQINPRTAHPPPTDSPTHPSFQASLSLLPRINVHAHENPKTQPKPSSTDEESLTTNEHFCTCPRGNPPPQASLLRAPDINTHTHIHRSNGPKHRHRNDRAQQSREFVTDPSFFGFETAMAWISAITTHGKEKFVKEYHRRKSKASGRGWRR